MIRLNTGYYNKGNLVIDKKKILKKYRKTFFIYDMMGIWGIIFSMIFYNPGSFY